MLNGRDCGGLNDAERTRLRRTTIGFVYQFHQLLPEFSALENVVMPQLILGRTRRQADARARELLEMLGLKERMDHRPAEMSGGEQQRTAIARGLANSPKLLLADEPTGNLDPETAERVFAELVAVIQRARRRRPDRHSQHGAGAPHEPHPAAGRRVAARGRGAALMRMHSSPGAPCHARHRTKLLLRQSIEDQTSKHDKIGAGPAISAADGKKVRPLGLVRHFPHGWSRVETS